MRLLELEVRDWRGLTQAITGIADTITLVTGPNESGKSRLQEGLLFAVSESYKGTAAHKQSLQTWGSNTSPWVRVAFDVGGQRYELIKQYLKGGYAKLEGNGQTLMNEDAEAALRQLLQASGGSGRTRASGEELGLWRLLVVRQGESRDPIQNSLTDANQQSLQARLSAEVGQAAISEQGQAIEARVEQEYLRYYTRGTGQESAEIKRARQALRDAEERLRNAEQAVAQQAHAATALQGQRAGIKDLEERVTQTKGRLDEAAARSRAAKEQAAKVRAAEAAVQGAARQKDATDSALKAYAELAQALAKAEQDLAAATAAEAAQDAEAQKLASAVEEARAHVIAAKEACRIAKEAVATAKRAARRDALASDLDQVTNTLRAVEESEAKQLACQRALASLPDIAPQDVQQLRRLERAVSEARIRLQAAAVHVSITAAKDLTVDGSPLASGEQIKLSVVDNQRIHLDGIADVEVRPGGGTLEELREAEATAKEALSEGLADRGVTSVEDAERFSLERQTQTQALDALKGERRHISTATRVDLEQRRANLQAQWEASPAEAAEGIDLDVAEQALERADASQQELEHALQSRRDALQVVETERVRLQANREHLQADVARFAQRLEQSTPKSTLTEALTAAEHQFRAAQAALAMAQSAYDALGGDAAEQDEARLARAHSALVEEFHQAQLAERRLEATLEAMQQRGEYDTLQNEAAAFELATQDLGRLLRQAAAAKRLYELVSTERQSMLDKLVAPVLQKVAPYLGEIFPGATLASDGQLQFTGLQVGNERQPFEELSGGAQEQLSLIVRLALAEVLAGDGRLPVVLDDALVNTDPERLQRLHRVLFRASAKLQLIVFSCHGVLFDDLGAERRLALPPTRMNAG